jgi:hypothetical protein
MRQHKTGMDGVKLSMNFTKHHTMNTYRGVEEQLDAFLTSALDGGKWSALCSGRVIRDNHWIGGWVWQYIYLYSIRFI